MAILPLALAVLLSFGQSNGNPRHCCIGGKKSPTPHPQCVTCDFAPNCKTVTHLSTLLSQKSELNPYYSTSVPKPGQFEDLNTVCITFLNVGHGVFLQFRTFVRLDGSVLTRKYLSADVTGSPGKYILAGSTNENGGVEVRYEYTITEVSCQKCQLLGYYSCTVYKSCADSVDYLYGSDNVFIHSTCKNPTSSCLNQTEAQLVASNNFNTPGFYNFPNTLPLKCVCSFNGIDVVNRNQIADNSCVSLP